uniref:Piwi-related protein n=1 Tax=Tetrahymena thermophila TaxID=5911 RepID=Q8MXZ9_TETTH|nr:piwi-related protein [Tetrahymena thermophila]
MSNKGLVQNNPRLRFLCNYYQVMLHNEKIYSYQFSVEGMEAAEVMKRTGEILKACINKLREVFTNKFLFQHSVLYSPVQLQANQMTEIGTVDTKTVSLKLLGEANNEREVQNIFGRLIKTVFAKIKLNKLGRKYFDPASRKEYNEYDLAVFSGYESSLEKYSFNQKLLNIDSCFKVQRTSNLLQALQQVKDRNDLSGFVGNTVITSYNGKFHRIESIEKDMSPNDAFEDRKGTKKTYMQYYKEAYNIGNIDPNQPLVKCVELKGKTKTPFTYYLIPSLCQVTGLTDQQRNDFNLMKKLAEVTKPKAGERIAQASKFIQRIKQDADKTLKDWSVEICEKPQTIDYKQLDAGNMEMQQGKKKINVATGSLDRDTQTQMFEQPSLNMWAIIYSDRDQKTFDSLLRTFQECLKFYNYPCKPPNCISVQSRGAQDWINALKNAPDNVQMAVFLLPGKKKAGMYYDEIKRYFTNVKPIPTQVILASTAMKDKGLRSVVNKLLMQICAKTGGVPWVMDNLPFQNLPTMVVGMDVFHNTPGKKESIFGFVSTVDRNFSKYYSHSHVLPTGQEITPFLQQVYEQALKEFKDSNGVYPQQIIIFRDGVGEGQFNAVKDIEMPQLKQACQKINGCENIKFTLIIVNKKVGAKFYQSQDGNVGSAENPPQGALIEDRVTKGVNDFFIVSQKTNQGTASPTHYTIIYNDMIDEALQKDNSPQYREFKRDLQVLAFKLCFLYYNWTGAIKTPSAVRYAHTLSNFVGDRYNPRKNDDTLIQAHPKYDKFRSLYFI